VTIAALTPLHIACPACGTPIGLPARLCLDYGTRVQILVDLGPTREHAREHQDALPATLPN
jgi:hypothetical protein